MLFQPMLSLQADIKDQSEPIEHKKFVDLSLIVMTQPWAMRS
jgi:hypothetical protein